MPCDLDGADHCCGCFIELCPRCDEAVCTQCEPAHECDPEEAF